MIQYPHWMLAGAAMAISCFAAQIGRAAEYTGALSGEAALETTINALAPAALGYASSQQFRKYPQEGGDYLGGAEVAGRVAGIYIKLAQGVFISMDQVPNNLRHSAERWVDVQFPEALANGLAEAPALLDANRANVEVGDAVEIRFAHPSRTRVFPIPEVTRVIAILAKNHEPVARDLERRILGRSDGPSQSPVASAQPADAETRAISAWLSSGSTQRQAHNGQP